MGKKAKSGRNSRVQMSNSTIVFLRISCIISSKFPDSILCGRAGRELKNNSGSVPYPGTMQRGNNMRQAVSVMNGKHQPGLRGTEYGRITMKKMKKFAALFLSAALVTACVACGNDAGSGESGSSAAEESGSSEASDSESGEASDAESQESSEASDAESQESSEASDAGTEAGGEATGEVMSYADYVAAAVDTEVVVETYVQAKQSWWENQATLYTQDKDGAYFVYNTECSQEDYEKLTPGTKIRVTGFKGEWNGEVEIMDSVFEIIEDGDSYVAEPEDVTALLGTDELIEHQNKFVSFKGMTVEPTSEGSEDAFLYNYDGSGEDGSDLYFNVSLDGQTYTFTVESYLCDNTTDVYAAVKNLKVGDKIDMEGFLYWYEGVNPHITSVTAAE